MMFGTGAVGTLPERAPFDRWPLKYFLSRVEVKSNLWRRIERTHKASTRKDNAKYIFVNWYDEDAGAIFDLIDLDLLCSWGRTRYVLKVLVRKGSGLPIEGGPDSALSLILHKVEGLDEQQWLSNKLQYMLCRAYCRAPHLHIMNRSIAKFEYLLHYPKYPLFHVPFLVKTTSFSAIAKSQINTTSCHGPTKYRDVPASFDQHYTQ